MSLSRILNDEPPPQRPGTLGHVSPPAPVPVRNAVEPPSYSDNGPQVRSPPVHSYREHHRHSVGPQDYIERSPSPRYHNSENYRHGIPQSPTHWNGQGSVPSKRMSPVNSRGPIPDDHSPHLRERPYESSGDYDGHPSNMYHSYPQVYDHGPPPPETIPEPAYYQQETLAAPSRSRRSRNSTVTYADDVQPPPPEAVGRKKKKIVDDGDYQPARRVCNPHSLSIISVVH